MNWSRPILLAAAFATTAALAGGFVEFPLEGDAFQAYDGEPLPLRKVARVEVSARTGVEVSLLSVNGRPVPEGTVRVDVPPGFPEFELRCVADGKVTVEKRKPVTAFPAGWLSKVRAVPNTDGTCGYLWIVFEKLRR